jgi:hypothetical protein
VSYLSRREEELVETKRSQALALQLLEVFTGQSTAELHRLNLLSGIWQSVDKNILRTLDGAQGKEGTAKLLLELIVWRALEYWLMEDGTPCGQSDADILAEYKAKVAAEAAKPAPVRVLPNLGPMAPRRKQQTWAQRFAGKSQVEIARLRAQRRDIQRRYRARLKAQIAPGS